MIQPRNTLVLIKLLKQDNKQVGALLVPNGNDCYSNAVVLKVGPGNVAAAGGRSDTYDLKEGQLVLVKWRSPGREIGKFQIEGVPIEEDGLTFYMLPEHAIVGIRAEPGQWEPTVDKTAN